MIRDAAKRLLAEAGYPDGFGITLDCPNNRYINDEAICRAVAAQLARIGVRVRLDAQPMSRHLTKIYNRQTDFYLLGLSVRGSGGISAQALPQPGEQL